MSKVTDTSPSIPQTCEKCGAKIPAASNLPLCDECYNASADTCCSDS